MPGLAYRKRLRAGLDGLVGVEVGYAAIDFGASGRDPSVLASRLRGELTIDLSDSWAMSLAAGASAFLVTTKDGEQVRWRPEGMVAVTVRPF